jgi:hypothetical protein
MGRISLILMIGLDGKFGGDWLRGKGEEGSGVMCVVVIAAQWVVV